MAALLVGMSVMAVLMSALLPVWSHMATREKEEELIFRGRQYARAIGLFQRKFANTAPPTIDVLVEQRFLRKKYKDPITNDDFQPIYANQAAHVRPPGRRALGGPASQRVDAKPLPRNRQCNRGFGEHRRGPQGGVIGVTSKSKDESIKIYNGRSNIQRVGVRLHSDGAAAGAAGCAGQGMPAPPGQPGPFGTRPAAAMDSSRPGSVSRTGRR